MVKPKASLICGFLIFKLFSFQFSFAQELNGNNIYGFPPSILSTKKISIADTLNRADTVLVFRDLKITFKDSVIQHLVICIGKKSIETHIIDSTVAFSDTLMLAQDTSFSNNEKFFRNIYSYSQKKGLLSKLLSRVYTYKIKPPEVRTEGKLVKSDKPFMRYEDQRIRKVEIVVLNAFGYNVKDSLKKPASFVEKAGNAVHIKSQKWVIRNKLLFKAGDKVDPYILSETERLLRQSNYLYDAHLYVRENTTRDSVDIQVVVQDVFSISVGGSGNLSAESANMAVQDVNFLGTGQLLRYKFKYWDKLPGKANHNIRYNISNISRTLIGTDFTYGITNGQKQIGIGANRELISPALTWVGGINFNWYKFPYKNGVTIVPDFIRDTTKVNIQDFWLGYAFPFFKKKLSNAKFIVAARFVRSDYFTSKPIIDADKYPYYDSKLYLGSFSLFSRKSYKDRFIFKYGKTEDIPEGILVSYTTGLHSTIRANRLYNSLSFSISKYYNNLGYYFANLESGAFLNKGKVEDGVLMSRFLYFSPLLKLPSSWKCRNFFGLRYTLGENMIQGNTITINKEQGLRGFSSPGFGSTKFIVNAESNIFMPFNILGFRSALVFFTDFAWLGDNAQLFNKSNFYSGYGIGFKIKNDHFTFNTIQVLFGYYPTKKTSGGSNYLIFQRNNSFYTFNDFNYSRPSLIPYY